MNVDTPDELRFCFDFYSKYVEYQDEVFSVYRQRIKKKSIHPS